jgi:hypothetical protein
VVAATLENNAPHAGIIEHGARPHPVSAEGFLNIFDWAWRHGMRGRSRSRRKKAETWVAPGYEIRFFGNEIPAAKAALGIVRKINREGQKPTYFIRNELPKLGRIMNAEVRKQLRKADRGRRR